MTGILFVIVGIYRNQFKSNYLRNKEFFLNFFRHFKNLYQILNILKPFESQHAKASQTLPKSAWQHFDQIF